MNGWKERMRKRMIAVGRKHTGLRVPVLVVASLFLVVYHSVKKFLADFLYHPVRQRITVGLLIAAFLAAQIGSGFVFADRGKPENMTILSFAAIEKAVLSQQVETGVSESDIVLPDSLKAKAEIVSKADEKEEEKEESAATGSSVQVVEEKTEKTEKKETETISVDVTWKLVEAETRAGEKKNVFDGNTAGTYRYLAVLPKEYKVAGDCEIPVITVKVKERAEEEEKDQPAENKEVKKDVDKEVNKKTSAIKGSARIADPGTADSDNETLPEDTDEETGVSGDEKATVTYNYEENGGISAEKEKASVSEGEKADLTVSSTKVGWIFVGWNTDADATEALEEVQVGTEDITLYAIYKKKLEARFYSGNSRMTPVEVTIYNNSESGTVTVPAMDSRTEETPVGYTSRSAGAVAETDPEVRAGESLTLTVDESPYNFYGIYKKTVMISYDGNIEGSSVAPAAQTGTAYTNIGTGEKHTYPTFTLAGALTKKGYSFSGWHMGDRNISGDIYAAGDKVTVATDTTFYGAWTDDITPVFGAAAYNDGYVSFWNWIIRKSNLILTVPVTEEGSGISTVSYELTPDNKTEAVRRGTLDIGTALEDTVSDGPVSATTEEGRTEITVTLDSDFKGKITLSCEDFAGNTSAKIIGAGVGGVIVEDNAPTITFRAGSGSSLTDLNEEPVDVSVQVTDGEEGRVSGGIKEVAYTVTNGGRVIAGETIKEPDFGADIVMNCGFAVRVSMDGENILRVTATDNAGNTSTRQQIINIRRTNPEKGNVELDTYQGANTPDTNLVTSQAELFDMVLNNEDKESVNMGLDIKVLLSVEDATGSVSVAERRLVEDNLGNYLLGQYLDISLFKVFGIDYRYRVEELKRPIRIQLTVPDSLKKPAGVRYRTYAVMRVHDGEVELLPDIDSQTNTVTIETDRFSTYVLVYRDTENLEEPDVTDRPTVTTEPGTTGRPNSTDQPSVTEEPIITAEPDVMEEPDFMEEEGITKKFGSTAKPANTKKTESRNDKKNQGPETGDRFPLEAYGILAVTAVILFLFLNAKRRKV